MFPTVFFSRFMSTPRDIHLGKAKRVLRYPMGTTGLGIWYSSSEIFELEGYTDNDWAECIHDSKSTSGYVFKIGIGVVCWSARKQEVVAQSTTEAKNIALFGIANQVV